MHTKGRREEGRGEAQEAKEGGREGRAEGTFAIVGRRRRGSGRPVRSRRRD